MTGAIRKYASSLGIKTSGVDRHASKKLSPEFWVEFVKMSRRLGAKPEDMARVIMSESAFDPAATAVRGGKVVARGLNQLTLSVLPGIGMSYSEWEMIGTMPAVDQLKLVERYYRLVGKHAGVKSWDSATQLYVANFAPAHLNKAGNPNAVLYKKYRADGSFNPSYMMNVGLDRKDEYGNRRGQIVVGDLTKSISSNVPKHIRDSIKAAEESLGGAVSPSDGSKEVESLISTLIASSGKLTKMVKNSILKE
jgi:hypothetical protein